MFAAIINAIHPHNAARNSTGPGGIVRARNTVSRYLNGIRPDALSAPRTTTSTRS